MTKSRRCFLRGALGGLALPFLPSALPRRAWAAAPASPPRLVFWYAPNGMQMAWFTPTREGKGYDLPSILSPLAAVQEEVSVLTGLNQEAGYDSRAGDHARGTGSFLTCQRVRFTAGTDIENGISVDQVAAQALAGVTPFASLQLGIEGGASTGDCDSGYSCAYARNISWSSPTTPLPPLTDPGLLFDRLFGVGSDGLTPEERQRNYDLRLSVLDRVTQDALALQGRLGSADRAKLDEYLTGLRELELRVQDFRDSVCEPDGANPGGAVLPEQVRLLTDLSLKALECDLTRVITFMLGNAGSYRSHDFLGIPEAHHELSHHGGDPDKLDKLVTIAQWEVEEFAYLVQSLSERVDATGQRLIDSTLAYFSSEIEDGDTHSHRNLPVLLAGRGGGAHRPGRHVRYTASEPIADLYLAMLAAVGVFPGTFGMDGTRPLAGLT